MARYIMRIELSGPAMKAFSGLSKTHGMTQLTMSSLLVDWFGRQPAAVQMRVLTPGDKNTNRETAKTILQGMMNKK
jgi:hypothetical protein